MSNVNEMRRRSVLAAALSIPVLLLLGAAEESPNAAAAKRDPRTLRVMCYNIHICQGMDKKLDPQRIADVIKREDIDVVALQEVDNKARRSGQVDQLAELARLTGMHGVFGKARDFDGGEYGQAILSRQPIEKLEVHKLTAPGEKLAPTDERIALVATIKQSRPLPDLVFVGTHLHHLSDAFRISEATVLNGLLANALAKREPAVMLLGDFNAKPDSQAITMLREKWDDPTADIGDTFPADKPDRKIDYILLPKGHGWKVVSAKVVDEPVASDHRPIVVELQWIH